MPFGTRIKSVAFAQASGIPQTFVENGTALTYVPPQRDVEGTGFYMPTEPTVAPVSTVEPPPRNGMVTTMRVGYWHNASLGQFNVTGTATTPPSRSPGWNWTPTRVEPRAPTEPPPLIGPDQFTGPPPPEIQRYDALPETPPPGPAVPPEEPMWQALWRQAQEQFMGPGPEPGPSFEPGRAFDDAQPGAVAVAGFDMQKLLLPVALAAGVFLFMRAR